MNNKPVLVVMAAGMGSRFGGLKQITPVTPDGDLILDFSIHDAVLAGFAKVIFIIKQEMAGLFESKVGSRLRNKIEVAYAFQEQDDLPDGFEVPAGREKPFGTGHAVLACRHLIDSPFVVINADDYYGRQAFAMIYQHLADNNGRSGKYAMISYRLDKTVTEHGHVARGICTVNGEGRLEGIVERTRIEKHDDRIVFTEDGANWFELADDTPVSMNFWGFTPDIIQELEDRFPQFLNEKLPLNPLKAEYFLPGVVDSLLQEKKVTVDVLLTPDNWYGVTYQEDRQAVSEALMEYKNKGLYPLADRAR